MLVQRQDVWRKAPAPGVVGIYVFKVELEAPIPENQQAALLEQIDETLCKDNLEYKSKRASGRLHAPMLQVMKPGWHEEEKKRSAADGKPVFQSKDVHLDSKQEFQPEPENVEAEVELDDAGAAKPAS